MERKAANRIFSSIHFWLPLSGVLFFICLFLLLNFINTGTISVNFYWWGLVKEGALILLQIIAVMYFVHYALLFFDKIYASESISIKRNIYELLVVITGGFVINKIFHLLFIKFVVVPEPDPVNLENRLRNLLVVTQVLVVIMYALMGSFRIYKNLQRKQLEVLTWQKEFAQSQFESLKNQLNPHFLFNSLSVLTSLVYEDACKAETFIDKLAKTYRYLLDQREKEAVRMGEEIQFLHNFRFLVGQRYGNKLVLTDDIATGDEMLYILPHTLLIILEYIIGTSTMSASKPLQISITVKNRFLLVSHNLQPKALQANHLQEQLTSLQQRYRQLDKELTLVTEEFSQLQVIKIPLLKQND